MEGRGAGQEAALMPSAALDEKLDRLPSAPGVYLMKDARGEVIYVGKAVNLRSRVRSYFGKSSDTRAFIPFLESWLADVDTVVVSNEKEALLLENELIKRYQPRFNVLLKDDKNFICLRLDPAGEWPRLEVVRLDDLLRRIATDFAPMARAKSLTLKVVASSLAVRSDPNLLRRLVQNLVSNAIKYTNTGKVLVGVRRQGGYASIQVFDSGIGIPSSKFRTVFKEFARLDEGARTAPGLGLGLSIVDRISRVLGHPVELQSTMGKGTSFKVRIPIDAAATARKAPASKERAPAGEPLRAAEWRAELDRHG